MGEIIRYPTYPPPARPEIRAQVPPGLLERHELSWLEAAAQHATRVYPGAVGELLARELRAHAEFGHRFAHHGLLARVARQVLAMPAAVAPSVRRAR